MQGSEQGGSSAHITDHFFHAVGLLHRDAAGIEGHALADEAQHVGITRITRIAQGDHAWRVDAACAHRGEAAHPAGGDLVLIQHFAGEAIVLG
ncbi:hypothetical protein D3C84_1165590 [compost metagenome]